MRVDLDSYREILDTLTRNKSRSFLTGFGVFWGVFMLIALIGGGQGLKEMLQSNFEGFATNTVMIWSQQTTKPYKGFRKGRWWTMDEKDIDRLRQRVPEPGRGGTYPVLALGEKQYRLLWRAAYDTTHTGCHTGVCRCGCSQDVLWTVH